MKTALKAALPTVLAIFLGWLLIEAAKYGKAKYQAEVDAKRMRDASAQVAAAQAADQSAQG